MRPAASASGTVSVAATGATRLFRIASASPWRSRFLSCPKQSAKRLLLVMGIQGVEDAGRYTRGIWYYSNPDGLHRAIQGQQPRREKAAGTLPRACRPCPRKRATPSPASKAPSVLSMLWEESAAV